MNSISEDLDINYEVILCDNHNNEEGKLLIT